MTDQPPIQPTPVGALRFNTVTAQLEYFDGNVYVDIITDSPERHTGATRALRMVGIKLSQTRRVADVEFITIDTTGNGVDFGDLTQSASQGAGLGSRTRAIAGGGTPSSPGGTNNIDFATIASTGNFSDFGDFITTGFARIAVANATRGVFFGKAIAPSSTNHIEYITIAATGNSVDFGDLTAARHTGGAAGNATRGIAIGGGPNSGSSTLGTSDFVTISSTGNAAEFGDLAVGVWNTRGGNCGNAVRGLVTGGDSGTTNTIQFVTISTLGKTQDFGDRTEAGSQVAHMSSTTRACFQGDSSPYNNVIDYVQVMTTGNAIDFGDLSTAPNGSGYAAGASNGHGGLG